MQATPPPIPVDAATGSTVEPIGQSINEGKGRIFPCDSCGADMVFHIGKQLLACQFCGFEKEIVLDEDAKIEEQDYHAMIIRIEEIKEKKKESEKESESEKPDEKEDGKKHASEVQCESCGATVVFLGSLTSQACPYCDSPIQRDNVHRAKLRIPVDGVLPFKITREKAKANLDSWIRSRWFAPTRFLEKKIDEKLTGIYLPYWTFDSMTATQYSGQRGEHYYVTVGTGKNKTRQRRTRWYPASGFFQRFFDDVTVMASHDLPQDLVIGLEPWPLRYSIPFTPQVLAGFLARTYETTLDQGFYSAKVRIDQALERDVRSRIGGDEQRISSIDTRYDGITFKHFLLPLWLLSYKYKNKLYQVLINAGTGEVQGQRPYSWVKIFFAIFFGAAIAGGLVLIFSQM